MIEKCSECSKSLGSVVQETMFGLPGLCVDCEMNRQAKHILALLPEDGRDHEWGGLSEWEQKFLVSVRDQFERKGKVSEKQFQVLDKIYLKLR